MPGRKGARRVRSSPILEFTIMSISPHTKLAGTRAIAAQRAPYAVEYVTLAVKRGRQY